MRRALGAWLLIGLLAASPVGVEVGGVFGHAQAAAQQSSANQIELTLSVEAEAAKTVIAHLIEPGGSQQALPLAETSSGLYRIIIEVRKVNYIVVFEQLGVEVSSQSQPFLLTDLGVASAVLGILTMAPEEVPQPSPATVWGWAGLGLAALSLLALAIWAWPVRVEREPDLAPTEAEVVG